MHLESDRSKSVLPSSSSLIDLENELFCNFVCMSFFSGIRSLGFCQMWPSLDIFIYTFGVLE